MEEMQALQGRVVQLEADLADCQASLTKLGDQLQIRDVHLQQKTFKVTELTRQVITATGVEIGLVTKYIYLLSIPL